MSKIEKEIQEATGEKGPKNNESPQKYYKRLVDAVQELPDPDWEALTLKTQEWCNAAAQSLKDGEEIEPFPDAKGDDEKPRSRRSRDDDDEKEDETPSRGKRSASSDDEKDDDQDDGEEDTRRSRGRRSRDDENEDGKPSRRSSARDDDEDGEKTASRSRRSRDDDDKGETEGDDDVASKKNGRGGAKKAASKKPVKKSASLDNKPPRPRKEGAQVAIKRAVIKDPTASTESIVAALEKKGLDATPSAVSTIRSGTLQTLRLVKEIGMPKGDF